MYQNKYDSEFKDEIRFGKKHLIWIVTFFAVLGLIGWTAGWFTKVVNPDTAIMNYEQFQEMWNTCQQINTQLGTVRAVPDTDRMFASFSKQAMIANKKQQLARWVEEYNGKSKMWNRALWKSSTLPYQLDVNQFSNFNEGVPQ